MVDDSVVQVFCILTFSLTSCIINYWNWIIKFSNYNCWIVYFSFSFCHFCFMGFGTPWSSTYTCIISYLPNILLTYLPNIIKHISLFLATFFIGKFYAVWNQHSHYSSPMPSVSMVGPFTTSEYLYLWFYSVSPMDSTWLDLAFLNPVWQFSLWSEDLMHSLLM